MEAQASERQTSTGPSAADPMFKEIMSRFPCGVVAITGSARGTVHALTVGTFFSASVEPRLIGFCVSRGSASWQAIRNSGRFGVNILADGQAAIAGRLARTGPGKLVGVPHTVQASGILVIEGALAALDCALEREEEAGDHLLVLGAVLEGRLLHDCDPVVYHRRRYRALALRAGPTPAQGDVTHPLLSWRPS